MPLVGSSFKFAFAFAFSPSVFVLSSIGYHKHVYPPICTLSLSVDPPNEYLGGEVDIHIHILPMHTLSGLRQKERLSTDTRQTFKASDRPPLQC